MAEVIDLTDDTPAIPLPAKRCRPSPKPSAAVVGDDDPDVLIVTSPKKAKRVEQAADVALGDDEDIVLVATAGQVLHQGWHGLQTRMHNDGSVFKS